MFEVFSFFFDSCKRVHVPEVGNCALGSFPVFEQDCRPDCNEDSIPDVPLRVNIKDNQIVDSESNSRNGWNPEPRSVKDQKGEIKAHFLPVVVLDEIDRLHVLGVLLVDHAPDQLPFVLPPGAVDLLSVLVVGGEVVLYYAHVFVVVNVDFLVEDIHHYQVLLCALKTLKHIRCQELKRHTLLIFLQPSCYLQNFSLSVHKLIRKLNSQDKLVFVNLRLDFVHFQV